MVPSATTRLSSRMDEKQRLLLPSANGTPALCAGGDGALGLAARQRQRLLAPDRLAGRRHRGNLLDMQRMRRRQEHRLHARIGDRLARIRWTARSLWPRRNRATSSGSLLTPRMKRRRWLLPCTDSTMFLPQRPRPITAALIMGEGGRRLRKNMS